MLGIVTSKSVQLLDCYFVVCVVVCLFVVSLCFLIGMG